MLIIFFISMIILGYIFRKSPIVTLYIMVGMYLLSVYKYNCADMDNYELGYYLIQIGSITVENYRYIGYYILQKIFVDLGYGFKDYCKIFYGVTFLLLYLGIRLNTNNVNRVLSLYLIYPFGMDVIQMKSFLADTLILLALMIWIKTQNINSMKIFHRVVLYVMCVILFIMGILVHFSTIYFIGVMGIYYLMNKRHRRIVIYANKKMGKAILIISAFLLIFTYTGFFEFLLKLLDRIIPFFNSTSMVRWLQSRIGLGIIFLIFEIIVVLCISKKIYKNYLKNHNYFLHSNFVVTSYQILITIYLTLVFLAFNAGFSRLFRVYFLLLYIMAANISNRFKTCIIFDRLKLNIGVIMVAFLGFILDILPFFDSTLGAILKYNTLFN